MDNILTVCGCDKKKVICDCKIPPPVTITLDMNSETHNNTGQCSCYSCNRLETKLFLNNVHSKKSENKT